MAADRDIGVALALALGRPARSARGWEMLAATGVRGLRVLNESSLLGSLLLTEIDPRAFEVLQANASRYRGLGARAELGDARSAPPGGPFDYIDLDPYGSPEPFLAAALDALAPGGLLAVTATDMRVLAGAERGACERRYSARPVRGRLGPEGGLRILLAWIARAAAERSWSVRPVAAYVRDHHVRAFLRLGPPAEAPPVGTIEPATFEGPRLRGDGPYGPMWLGPLFEPGTMAALATPPTCEHPVESGRFLDRLKEEAGVDAPFYYEPNELARDLGMAEPPPVAGLLQELHRLGWAAARTHARPAGIRTPAPRTVVEGCARDLAEATRTPASGRSFSPP
jgi:tRNA (guanine26-N2/guanine27-N2)-dimethyltransferase